MIEWINDKLPEPGQRVLKRLNDGRVCSGRVTETLGFEIDHVDALDLLQTLITDNMDWYPLEEKKTSC